MLLQVGTSAPIPFVWHSDGSMSEAPARKTRPDLAADGQLPKQAMARGIKTVLSGQGLAYAVTFGTLPLLAMLYSPFDFAALGIFTAIVAITGAASSLCYPNTIPLAKDDRTAASAVGVSLLLTTCGSLGVVALFSWLPTTLLDALGITWLLPYRSLLGVTICGIGWQQAISSWCVRRQSYHALARGRVLLTLVRVAAQLALGLFVEGPWGLIFGYALGSLAGAAVIALQCLSDRGELGRITMASMRHVLYSYRQFALFGTLPEIIQRLVTHLPGVLLAVIYDYQVAGWYILTQRIFGTPQTILHQSISRVYMGVGAREVAADPRRLRELFRFTLQRLLLLASGPYLLFMLAAPTLLASVLADDWATAGIYCSLLTPMFFVRLIYDSLRPTIDLLEKPQIHTIASCILTVALSIGLLGPYWMGLSAGMAIVSLSVSVLAGQVLAIAMIWRAIDERLEFAISTTEEISRAA